MGSNHLILLHGALGASAQYIELLDKLKDKIDVSVLDFEGHGGSKLIDRPFRLKHFAENVLDFLTQRQLGVVHIFGHSLGGHVGLYLARHFPDCVASVFTFGTKFNWTRETAEKENQMLIPENMIKKVPGFVEALRNRHQPTEWTSLIEKVREMHLYIGSNQPLSLEDVENIKCRARIGQGDRDKIVSIEESMQVFRSLPEGELQIFPSAAHPLERVSIPILSEAILEFVQS